ncbi:hypothetical protein DFJ63DRAFT_25585 [Scheffersomyces coipomensis]|uniref:uncharacterized protein n=1 Tax=Scheffersomyces coipomensis TaxID=1788519 RepID=UPI00315D7914
MNTNFTTWASDNTEKGVEDSSKFDPSFTRHHDENNEDGFHSVVDEVAAAAVANVHHNDGSSQDEQVRAAHEAAAAVAAARLESAYNLPHDNGKKSSQQLQIQQGQSQQSQQSQQQQQLAEKYTRVVSTTKRAAQNRSAQRAFRQRKDKYIKDLESKAAEIDQLRQTIDELRSENLQLRDYTLALQSRLIETGQALGSGSHNSGTGRQSISSTNDGSHSQIPTLPAGVYPKGYHNEK